MKKLFITMLLVSAMGVPCAAQGLSLAECRSLAHDNYPAVKRYNLIEQTRGYDVSNALKAWLPQVSVTAGAAAFSDMVAASVPVDMENWMAGASLSISQSLYDGGQTAARRGVLNAQADMEATQNDVTMYAVNERVEAVFFGLLAIEEQLGQNKLLHDDLELHADMIRSMMRGGVANQSDLDAVRVEIVKVEQQRTVLETQRDTYLRVLERLVGRKVSLPLQKPAMPDVENVADAAVNRPELAFYASQNALLDAQRRHLDTRLRPVVSLFGMGMAHTDVTEMMRSGMVMGGLSMKWNIGALYTRKNDLRRLEAQREMNDSQREVFMFNNRIQNQESSGAIASMRRQLSMDDEIVTLRAALRKATERKVEQGTESVNELLRQTNAVSMARQQKALHEILLLQEIYRKKNINNN